MINVVRDGVTSAVDEPLLKGVPPIGAGQPLGGRFFPLVFDSSRDRHISCDSCGLTEDGSHLTARVYAGS